MQQSKSRLWVVAITATLTLAQLGNAADHGPVFGLATPTNPEGGWSFDLGVNGRSGTASTLEAELTYGITQNLKLAVSGPVVFQPDAYPRSSVTTNTPSSGDFSGLVWWPEQRTRISRRRGYRRSITESVSMGGRDLPTLHGIERRPPP